MHRRDVTRAIWHSPCWWDKVQACASVTSVRHFRDVCMSEHLCARCANAVAAKVTYSAHLQISQALNRWFQCSCSWDRHSRCAPLCGFGLDLVCLTFKYILYHNSEWTLKYMEVRSRCTILEGLLPWVQVSSPPQCVLTGWLTVVLIPQLKITWVFYSIYVTGLGGAKPAQTNASDCCTAVETHLFTSAPKPEPFSRTQTHPLAWTVKGP